MRTIGLLLALLGMTCSPLVAVAQCGVRKRVSCAPPYVAPVVVQHAPEYVAPVLTTFVPIAVPTYSVTYAPGEPYATENLALRQLVQQLQGQLQQSGGQLVPAPVAPVAPIQGPPPPTQGPEPPVAGPPAGAAAGKNQNQAQPPQPYGPGEARRMPLVNETVESKAIALLTSRCAQCHTGNAARGSMIIFEAPGRLSPTFNRAKVIKACYSEKMPPKEAGAKLTDEEVSQLIDGLGT